MEAEKQEIAGHIDDDGGKLFVRHNSESVRFVMGPQGELFCEGDIGDRLIVKDDGGLYVRPIDNEH